MVSNLGEERKSWRPLLRILIREVLDPKVSVHFYKAMAQVVLLFRAETWLFALSMEQALDSFQHRVV